MTAETFIAIPDSQLDVGKPALSTTVKQMRDNLTATAQGHSAAPRIAHQGMSYQDFTSNGTFNVPDYCSKVFVQLCGGGGGGGQGNSGWTPAGFAQCGGYAEGWCNVTPGGTVSVTVGAGGLSGNPPSVPTSTNGGTSSFGSLISATGGVATPSVFADTTFPTSGTDQQKADWVFRVLLSIAADGHGVGGDFNMSGAIGGLPGFGNGSARYTFNGSSGVVPGEAGSGVISPSGHSNGHAGLVRVWY